MLRDIALQRLAIEDLCRRYGVRRLALFGSARGPDFDPSRSDLDFVVELPDLPPAEYAEAYFSLLEALQTLFERPVDLITDVSIRNPYLRREIERTQAELYAA